MAVDESGPTSATGLVFDLLQPRAVEGYLDEHTLLHVPGTSGMAGDYQGREAIVGLLEAVARSSALTLRFEAASLIEGTTHTWRLAGTLRGERAGCALEIPATVKTAVTGNRVREAWLECSDQAAWDAFWG
jgi:hypothetical protein